MSCRARHHSRADAMACPLFRSYKVDQVHPFHGASEFTWQLTIPQQAIMGSIVHHDPHPAGVERVFAPIVSFFDNEPEEFAEDLFYLRALGLIWIDCESGLVGYTEEGREHVDLEFRSAGSSLALHRLQLQAENPGVVKYQPVSFIDRTLGFLERRTDERLQELYAHLLKRGTAVSRTRWIQ